MKLLKPRDRKREYMKAYLAEYNARPEVVAHKKAYAKKYNSKPENRQKKNAARNVYRSRPEVKERLSAQAKTYYVRIKGTRSEKRLMREYGLTRTDWGALFEDQGWCCAVCRSFDPKSPTGWHTDHDHKSGHVRGILCHSCNLALGLVQDDVRVLKAAIQYLQRTK